MGRPPTPLAERFWPKVNKNTGTDCWEWTAPVDKNGYGRIWYRGRNLRAHRAAYLMAHGEFPEELLVMHSCDNPTCVRVDHLSLGTNTDNQRDAAAKGRSRGQKITHCPKGHEYTPENTYWGGAGKRNPTRFCRQCAREYQRMLRQRRREQQCA